MDGYTFRPAPAPVRTTRAGTLVAPTAAAWLCACLALGVAACSSAPGRKADPVELLHDAKSKVDSTSALHFSLTSTVGGHGGTTVLGGEGNLARPDSIDGQFTVRVDGLPVDVKVVSKSGIFAAELPFGSGYVRADPSKFGLEDPAQLMDPDTGLTRMLVVASDPRMGPRERLSGELLDSVEATIPGKEVPVLPDAAPDKPVQLVALVNPDNDELREVRLTGPFASASSDGTYVLLLTDYGEHAEITLPPGI